MDTSDIDVYLKAKRQHRLLQRITWVCATLALVFAVLSVFRLWLPYTTAVVYGCLLGGLLANSDLFASRTLVTRARLLNLIESQINRDPEAIKYVAGRIASARVG